MRGKLRTNSFHNCDNCCTILFWRKCIRFCCDADLDFEFVLQIRFQFRFALWSTTGKCPVSQEPCSFTCMFNGRSTFSIQWTSFSFINKLFARGCYLTIRESQMHKKFVRFFLQIRTNFTKFLEYFWKIECTRLFRIIFHTLIHICKHLQRDKFPLRHCWCLLKLVTNDSWNKKTLI